MIINKNNFAHLPISALFSKVENQRPKLKKKMNQLFSISNEELKIRRKKKSIYVLVISKKKSLSPSHDHSALKPWHKSRRIKKEKRTDKQNQ